MDRLKLRLVILDFLDAAEPSMHMEDPDSVPLTRDEVVSMWMGLPDCQLTHMFLGFALARGIDIDTFTPHELQLAIQTVSIGVDDVDFDWLGDCDATHKPH